jgi:putative ABC transport system ATP-binding protein
VTALDSQRARIVMDLLRRSAADQSAAIIVVTHDEMILDRFDHIFRLRDGRLDSDTAGRTTAGHGPAMERLDKSIRRNSVLR